MASTRPVQPNRSAEATNLGRRILELFRDVYDIRQGEPNRRDAAAAADISESSLSRVVSGKGAISLDLLAQVARSFFSPLEEFFDRTNHPGVATRKRISWTAALRTASSRERAMRAAGMGVLSGEPWEATYERVATLRRGAAMPVPARSEANLHGLARAAFHMGLVDILQGSGFELEDVELSDRLKERLAHLAPNGGPAVHVVKNLCHPEYRNDPAAPFLAALRAHAVLLDFFMRNPDVRNIGLSGGAHLETFVRCTGPTSSPIPDRLGGSSVVGIVPLTSEPRNDHQYSTAEALVGSFSARVADLLGGRRHVSAPSFKAFGRMENRQVGPLQSEGVIRVRQCFRDLEVAVFGCGDDQEEGWVRQLNDELDLRLEVKPVTEIALRLLDRNGDEVPLVDSDGTVHELLGVSLRDIRRIADREEHLTMLLTSGKAKGVPMVATVRGGYANVVICDQRAALAALDELDRN